jgi:hypothetical protein
VPGISWTKELIEEVDQDKHIFAYKVVDGDVLQKCSSFRVRWEFKPQLAGPGTDVNWTAEVVPLPYTDKDTAQEEKNTEAARRNDIYRESARLLMKQLETHLIVTGEYGQPSAKDRLRDDLLLN